MRKIDIISTVVRRSLTGEKIPSGNTIVFEGGNIDIDSILDKLSVEMRDKYLSKTTDDEALGLINFKQGLKIGGVELKYDQDNNAVFIERADGVPVNFYVTGGMAMYGLGNTKVTSILDAIEENLDPNTLGIVNGKLTVIGGGSGGEGGITTVTKQMVIDALGFTPYSADNPNGYITAASIPSALKNPYALTFGSKTYDGSAAKEITASDLGAALSSDLAKYLPLTGGTVNGIVNLNYNLGASSYIRLTNNRTKESSGWAVSMYDFCNHENVSMARLGAFGGVNTLSYLHLGHYEYDGNNLRIYTDKVTFGENTIWHAGNDGSGSGLDADTLDGVHLMGKGGNSGIMRAWSRHEGYTISKQYFGNGNVVVMDPKPTDDSNLWANTTIFSLGDMEIRSHQLAFGYGKDVILYRRVYDGPTYNSWKTIAFTDSNVASATKLQTARTIWGQSFDGTADVTGILKMPNNNTLRWLNNAGAEITCMYLSNENKFFIGNGVAENGYDTYLSGKNLIFRYGTSRTVGAILNSSGNITIGATDLAGTDSKLYVNGKLSFANLGGSNPTIQWSYGEYFDNRGNFHLATSSGDFNIYNSSNGVLFRVVHSSGNVVIGGTVASAKLHVVGNILATGGVTMQSARILKNIVDERGLSLAELSVIKPTRYTWKDKRDDRIHIGGIADDIEKVLPEVIYKTSDGTLTMDYGNAGFAIASSLIQPVVDHEARIAALEKENKELKEQLNRLSA